MHISSAGLLAALFSSVFSSISVIFQIRALGSLPPLIISSLSLLLGATFFLIYFSLSSKMPGLSAIRKEIVGLSALIVLRCVAGNFLFVYSLSLTTGIKAMFFTKAEPYFVLLWYWILKKQSVNRKHLLLLAVHLMAAVLLSSGGVFKIGRAQIGDILILIAMACSSLSYFYGIEVSKSLGAKTTNAITQLAGGLLLLPFAIIFVPAQNWSPNSYGWIYLFIHVLLFNVLALTLWFHAIKSVDAWIVSALRAVGPLVAAPLAWIFLGESLNSIQIIAAFFVLLTSALIAREHFNALKMQTQIHNKPSFTAQRSKR